MPSKTQAIDLKLSRQDAKSQERQESAEVDL
jgi:hypothetical protein